MCGTYTHSAVIISFKYPSQERKILPAARTTFSKVVQFCLRRKLPVPGAKRGLFCICVESTNSSSEDKELFLLIYTTQYEAILVTYG